MTRPLPEGAKVRLTQVDGKLPNLALMNLAWRHRGMGHEVHFTKSLDRDMLEPAYDRVYASAIFSSSAGRVERLRSSFPEAVVGGTWSEDKVRVSDLLGSPEDDERFDYSIYPDFHASIGFTQRGCRLKCGFCSVPAREGKARSVNTVADIWRGDPWPRELHLLDNDLFGQPREEWEARLDEVRTGGFKVCINQGINVRMIDDTSAAALASIPYYDDSFTTRRLYTAWDNLKDEHRFLKGVNTLRDHGIPPTHLLVYMLVGWDPKETWERLFRRFDTMVALGIRPYPMVYGDRERGLPLGDADPRVAGKTLKEFQRWVIRKAYTHLPFAAYDVSAKGLKVREQLSFLDEEPEDTPAERRRVRLATQRADNPLAVRGHNRPPAVA